MNLQNMRCAVFSNPHMIHIEQRPIPVPEATEALIQVECVAICGSDQARFWDSGAVLQNPVVFGHEFSGRIVSSPECVSDLQRTACSPSTVAKAKLPVIVCLSVAIAVRPP